MRGGQGYSARELGVTAACKYITSEDIDLTVPRGRDAFSLGNGMLNFIDANCMKWYLVDIGFKITTATLSADPSHFCVVDIGLNGDTDDDDYFVRSASIRQNWAQFAEGSCEDGNYESYGWKFAAPADENSDVIGIPLPADSFLDITTTDAGAGPLTQGTAIFWALVRPYDSNRDPRLRD